MSSLYEPLPQHIQDNLPELGLKSLSCSSNQYVEAFVQRGCPADTDIDKTMETMKQKGLMLDCTSKGKKNNRPKRLNVMNSFERRKHGIFKIAKENHRYNLYLPLHELWKQYISEALAVLKSEHVNVKSLYPKLIKADFHGSIITVFKSKCPGYVGLTGILLQETKNTFKIITKDDKIKTIPKANSVFTVDIARYRCTMYGNQMRVRTAERSSKKFKSKPTIDL